MLIANVYLQLGRCKLILMFDAALCCFVKCKVLKTETECSSEIVSEGLHDRVLASVALNWMES